jgi:deoxyribonuclease-4
MSIYAIGSDEIEIVFNQCFHYSKRYSMRRLGVHTSIAGGLHLSLERAHELGCSTMQIFSHNPRGWAVKTILAEAALQFRLLRERLDISPVYIHASYLINIASRDMSIREKSIEMLVTEMDRADILGADYVILHTGSASGDDEVLARKRAVAALNEMARQRKWRAGLLLENTAGERGDISSGIKDIAEIMHTVQRTLISGICFDTCHAFAAGYNIRDEKSIRDISDEIKKHMGIDKIKLIHLNDSKGDAGSRRDRHEHIGLGKIGVKGLRCFLHHRPFRDIPLILETPKKRETDDQVNLKKVGKMIM